MNKYLLYGLVVGAVAAVVLLFTTTVFATQNPKVNICHQTESENHPYNAIRVDDDGHWNGHDEHEGDFLYEGPVRENGHPTRNGDEWCEENVPEEEPTPTPSPTPEPEEFCDDDSAVNYGADEECRYEEQPTPTPTPSPEPEKTVTTQSQPGPASAPVCSDSVPGEVANIFVDTGTPNDGKLEVRWLPKEPKGSKAHIRYSEVDGEWKYSLLNTDNDGVEEIGSLVNGTHYWFQVAQVNGCAVGPYSRSFDPLP